MTIIEVMILGLVEGATEFLPISSTAHLIITSSFLRLPQSEFISFFEVFIQSGAILAVIFLYFDYIRKHQDLIPKVLISFVPTAIIGFFMREIIKTVFFQSMTIIASSLFIVGILFIVIEMLIQKKKLTLKKSLTDLSYQDAFFAGLIQSFAIIPGVSRAGAVIVGMMFMKYKRSEGAVYSYLLAVPTIIGASILDLVKTDYSLLTNQNIMIVGTGFLVSFFSALMFIKWFIKYLQSNSLTLFGLYRIILAIIVFSAFI
ncbi:hypothetical protein A3H80_02565 [Candidatus Roizmanbacteria bacterium RIFCSPLOWO2_02_FULL_37_19]|uniref:Undecaprenyl-diphosphatase n=1 Tax=Candidatus Roizmanbacteria bacterium RIFCSPHIGHO2_02_FULL_37_24 TaxID=1802037 RepID=A0A1F7H089_9BACT|nr:MAG: hypothetical protein A2862_02270 [Candidatus Roizmanbacteria bacterium RIFCSPHIGHO2_01_FULL_38_41]OGK24810.1 MAG: hypothetical protein A3C24_00720 [Candidatus Roizmanbacteria bacterium RIFCSPHIGHO2_02_FULL_37_24]OGK32792.1 MAG: hypothetical protein A3E10_03315 [Candidatus Roizmanbacteria bacterium RIFCSPHIGHO2_12_FULL_37_23]OGK45582.1 MAG: hypothetical protein A2956_02715 [Candidatus Roizmanbacteria bacterium RIFCSPLOWO2_01_FULL_37_57]OGK53626.1 MAG: hypothetical protein A3H80_02565 [Ca